MAPHSSALAWEIRWMEEPGGLQSMGSLRVGHDSIHVDCAVRQKDNTSHLHNLKFPENQQATRRPSFTMSLEILCVISTSGFAPACLTCSGAARGE